MRTSDLKLQSLAPQGPTNLGTGALKGLLRAYYSGTWEARELGVLLAFLKLAGRNQTQHFVPS